jgi:hypothetical protein
MYIYIYIHTYIYTYIYIHIYIYIYMYIYILEYTRASKHSTPRCGLRAEKYGQNCNVEDYCGNCFFFKKKKNLRITGISYYVCHFIYIKWAIYMLLSIYIWASFMLLSLCHFLYIYKLLHKLPFKHTIN